MDLFEQARRRYEWGRLRAALPVVCVVPPLALAAWCGCAHLVPVLVCSGALALLAVFFVWRGESLGRAVVPGFLGGAVPLAIVASLSGCGRACGNNVCLAGGLAAGLIVALLAKGNRPQLLASAVLAALTGAMGCAVAGATGLLGLGLGLVLAAAPTHVWRAISDRTGV